MIFWIFITFLIILIFISFFKKDVHGNKEPDNIPKKIHKKYTMTGRKFNLKCNDTVIKPFMIRNRCKKYVHNDGYWEFNHIEDNKYNVLFNNINLCSDENGVCFYKEEQEEKKENSCKSVCSSEHLFEDTNNIVDYFYVDNINDNIVKIKNKDGKYLCLVNNKLSTSDYECNLELHPL
jgi:hypothetical protein